MHTGVIPVCSMDLFNEGLNHFWIGCLKGLTEKHPELEIPHKNTFVTLLIVERGSGEVMVDSERIGLAASKAVIIKPGCINTMHPSENLSGKMICFAEDFFSLRYNSNALHQFSFLERDAQACFRIPDSNKGKVEDILRLLYQEYQSQGPSTLKVLRSYLNIFLFEMERCYSPVSAHKVINHAHEKIQEFERLVEHNFVQWKLPSLYADKLNVSTNYLNKLCKREAGSTAGDIIRRHIILEAQRLLHYTRLSVGEISAQLGFENTSYFVTIFKKHTKNTPEQFRKSQNA